MHHGYRQSLWRHFLNWNVPFRNGSSLCQVDIKLSHKCLFCFCLNLPPTSPCGSVHIPLYFICLNGSRPPVSRCGMNRWVNGNNEFSSFLQHPQGCRLIWESVMSPQKQKGIGTHLTCESTSAVHRWLSSALLFHSLIILYTHEASTSPQGGIQRVPPTDPSAPEMPHCVSLPLPHSCSLSLPRFVLVAFPTLSHEVNGL